MKFDLKQPCKSCPFRTSTPTTDDEQARIWLGIEKADHTMSCHDTVIRGADGIAIPHAKEQHCAGAMLVLEARGQRNNAMAEAATCGTYDPSELRSVSLRGAPPDLERA